jgi:putative nucleotidyltransferase with HDIG domain
MLRRLWVWPHPGMKDANPTSLIDVQLLRIGMFVHLDGGWMGHPFPLSSFKISAQDQIQIIRGLGHPLVRWFPEKSDPDPALALPVASGPVTPAAAPESPEAAARRLHREALSAQRASLLLCERQFAEAAKACKHASDLVVQQPQHAREEAEALAQSLVNKLLGSQEMCIRLLTDAAGDKAAFHAVNVSVISLLMGRVFGLSPEEMHDLGVGAMLHDMGKVELPERVRHREEHFSAAEVNFYQEHVAKGVALGRRMGLQPGAMLVIAQHHEHADGSGFPLKLSSDRMGTAARIVSLVNRYDNMCNPHVPSRALTPHEAVSLLFAQGKNRYDTAILGAFIRMMGVYPPGSTVQLTDDRYAVVVQVNSSRPLKPRVLVHEPGVPREDSLVVDLDAHGHLGIRRSLKPQQLPPEALHYLSPRARVAYFFEPLSPVPQLHEEAT